MFVQIVIFIEYGPSHSQHIQLQYHQLKNYTIKLDMTFFLILLVRLEVQHYFGQVRMELK